MDISVTSVAMPMSPCSAKMRGSVGSFISMGEDVRLTEVEVAALPRFVVGGESEGDSDVESLAVELPEGTRKEDADLDTSGDAHCRE